MGRGALCGGVPCRAYAARGRRLGRRVVPDLGRPARLRYDRFSCSECCLCPGPLPWRRPSLECSVA
eukprot:1650517-Lingulodinium_polyedra.AAC.1